MESSDYGIMIIAGLVRAAGLLVTPSQLGLVNCGSY
jgi:hypothetical protein